MKKFLIFKKLNFKSGFTLAELLVGMSIFAFVVALAGAIFIKAIKNERRLIIVMNMTSDLSSALEQMSREIRTGFLFGENDNEEKWLNELGFINSDSGNITYNLENGKILRNGTPITSPDIQVDYLNFIIAPKNICDPWRITIILGVSPRQTDVYISPFYIQTTVSSRILPKDMPIKFKNDHPEYYQCQ